MDGSKLASVAGSVALTVAGLTIDPSAYLPWVSLQQSGGGQQAGGSGGPQGGGGQQGGQQGGRQGGQQGDADEGQEGESEQPDPQDVGEQPDAEFPDAQDEPGRDNERPIDRDDTLLDRDDTRLDRRGTQLDRDGRGRNGASGRGGLGANGRGGLGANGAGGVRTGQLDDGSSLFMTDPALLDQRLRDTAVTLQRLEDQLIQRNDALLLQLGQARQLTGERRLDAMAQIMQDFLQQQREFMDYTRRVRLGLTGDGSLGNQTLGTGDAFTPEFGGDRLLDQRTRNTRQGAAQNRMRGGDAAASPDDRGNNAFEDEMRDDTAGDGNNRSGGNRNNGGNNNSGNNNSGPR